MTPSRNLGECATDPWDATGESDLQEPELAGNQDVGRAAVSETNPMRHCQEGGNNKEQRCTNSWEWEVATRLPTCVLLGRAGKCGDAHPSPAGGQWQWQVW